MASCDAVVVVSIVNGDAMELDVSTCTWYDAAFCTSFQSSVTGSDTCAPFDGARSVGATGVPPDGGGGFPPCTVNTAPQLVFSKANTFACTVDDEAPVETVNVAVVEPAGTMTVGGTVAGLHADS